MYRVGRGTAGSRGVMIDEEKSGDEERREEEAQQTQFPASMNKK
jgi:hypothetical protein